jgi:ribosomal protein S18 acetylase RimI-like enzyme
LVLQNDAPIGALVLLDELDAMLIYSIAIAPSHQRKGLGRMLLRFAEQQAQLKGYEKIKLYTNERMDDNVDYYKRFGYIETHREPYGETIVVYMAKQVEHYENI